MKNSIVVILIVTVLTFGLCIYNGFFNEAKVPENPKQIVLKESDNYIQWKYEGEESWRILMSIDKLKGKDGQDGKDGAGGTNGVNGLNGRKVQFKNEDNIVYWKYSDEAKWTKLIEVNDGVVNEICETRKVIANAEDVDCIKNKTTCAAGTLLHINVTTNPSDAPMNYYVLSDDGEKLTLLVDRNIGSDVQNFAWYIPIQ